MRKRDRECFESNTATYMFPDVTKPLRVTADAARPQALCATALALVENPHRLAAYVNQLSREYMMLFINDTIPATAMTKVLKSNNYFWYLLWQRVAREAPCKDQVDYQHLIKRII